MSSIVHMYQRFYDTPDYWAHKRGKYKYENAGLQFGIDIKIGPVGKYDQKLGTLRQKKQSEDDWSLVLDYPVKFYGDKYGISGLIDFGLKIDFIN